MALVDEEYKVELLKKLPVFHRKIYEYQQITKALTPELEALLIAIDYVLDNWYINTADEKGLSRLEKIAGITPEVGDSLDTRRFKLLVKMTEKIPYTDETLEERLNSLCGGNENYSIVRDYLNYKISINTTLGVVGAFDLVTDALVVMLPQNLILELTNTLKAELFNLTYIGGVCNTAFSYVITHDKDIKNDLGMDFVNAVGLSEGSTHTITHDISVFGNTGLALNFAVGMGEGYTHNITHDLAVKDSLQSGMNFGAPTTMGVSVTLTHDIQKTNNVTGNSTVGSPVNTATVITIN